MNRITFPTGTITGHRRRVMWRVGGGEGERGIGGENTLRHRRSFDILLRGQTINYLKTFQLNLSSMPSMQQIPVLEYFINNRVHFNYNFFNPSTKGNFSINKKIGNNGTKMGSS